MAKELPYFQFEPAEYLTKDISFCSLSAQGLFINICSFYWQRQCELSEQQFLRRFNYPDEFNELINEGVISVENGFIKVKFLDLQYQNAINKSSINSSNGAKGGRPKKQIKTEIKPKENQKESESKGIRKDNIIKEDIREEKTTLENNFSLNKKSDNEKFKDDLLTSQMWLESVAMSNRLTTEQVKLKINDFTKHLFEIGDDKVTKKDFQAHFARWLPKQPKEEINQKRKISPI